MGTGHGHKDSFGPAPSGIGGGAVSAPMGPSAAVSGVISGTQSPTSRERHGAIVLDKNQKNGKRLARILVSAGYSVKTFEDESAQSLAAILAGEPEMASWLLCAELSSASSLCTLLARPEARRSWRGVLYYGGKEGEPEPDVPTLCEQPGLVAVLGVRSQSSRDLEMELLGVATYLRGQPLVPMQAYLLWGAAAYSTAINNVAGRDAAEARIVKLCSDQLNVGSRIANSIGEVVHELLTNAMYDAPVDAQGRTLYAHDRTAQIQLAAEDRVTFRYGTDGLRLVVEAVDRFGRLRRTDLAKSLRRAAAGQVNRAQNATGAGIGLSMIYRTTQALQIDIEPGTRTRVTAVFDLDAGRSQSQEGKDGTRPGRSLIFPDLTLAAGRRDL